MEKLTFRVARPEDAEALVTIYAPYVEETAITFEYEVPSVETFRARIAHTLATYPYIVAVEEQPANAGAGHADGTSSTCIDRSDANAGTVDADGVPASSTPAAGADAAGGTCRTSEHIIGYAYVGRLHERAAYDWTVETSIYVDRRARKHGLGRQLYERLEAILRAMNIISVNACIAYPGTMNATDRTRTDLQDRCTERGEMTATMPDRMHAEYREGSADRGASIGEDPYLNTNSPDFHAHLGYQLVGHFHACAYKFDRWYDMIWMEKWIAPHPAKPEAMIPFPELPEEVVERCLK